MNLFELAISKRELTEFANGEGECLIRDRNGYECHSVYEAWASHAFPFVHHAHMYSYFLDDQGHFGVFAAKLEGAVVKLLDQQKGSDDGAHQRAVATIKKTSAKEDLAINDGS